MWCAKKEIMAICDYSFSHNLKLLFNSPNPAKYIYISKYN